MRKEAYISVTHFRLVCVWHTTGVCNTPQCALHTSEGVSDGTKKAHLIWCVTHNSVFTV